MSLEDFEKFWNKYNKKTDKLKTIKIWSKLSEKEKEHIFKVLDKYISKTPNIEYRKNPTTWLNGKCWNDEVLQKEKTEIERMAELGVDIDYFG